MNNTITMTDIEVSLQSILALMQLTQEGMESDIHTAVNAGSNDAACIPSPPFPVDCRTSTSRLMMLFSQQSGTCAARSWR